jgi:hypothetical protein
MTYDSIGTPFSSHQESLTSNDELIIELPKLCANNVVNED